MRGDVVAGCLLVSAVVVLCTALLFVSFKTQVEKWDGKYRALHAKITSLEEVAKQWDKKR